MADKKSGVVEKIYENQTSKGLTTYTIVVDGERYGTYTQRPPCKQGDAVEFYYKNNGSFNNVDVKTIKKVAEATPSTAAPTSGPVPSYAKRNDDVQNAITFQAARKDALQFLEILVGQGILDSGSKAKGKQIEVMETYLDKYTQRFFDDTKSLGHVKQEENAPSKALKVKAVDVEQQEDPDDEIPF